MFCSKCGSNESPSGAKFCISCGSTLTAISELKTPTGSNICWNCGEGKQPVVGNCSKCGMNLAGEESLSNASAPTNNWKLIAIPIALAIVAFIIFGFSKGVSPNTNYANQGTDSSKSVDTSQDTSSVSASGDIVTTLLNYLQNNGSASWSLDPYNDASTGADGILLSDECAIWVYPTVSSKTAAINDGVFDGVGDPYFWWDDDPNWSGVVLIASSETAYCALDAEQALGWNLQDFSD